MSCFGIALNLATVLGPEHMKFFGDFCMRESPSGGGGAYSYTVCPYHNVTQLDTRVGDSTDVVVG